MSKKETLSGNVNILFCGTGGQGVLAAAEICCRAAMFDGYHVKKSEVHGMAQRGGSVESHVCFGKEVFSPLIPKGEADFLVSFHGSETERLKDFLKPKKGVDLTPAIEKGSAAVADKRYVNVFILGVLSKYLVLSEKSWMQAIEDVFRKKNLQENIRAFKQGRESGL